jgi:hypothetical protein
MNIERKTILITGANRGIGRALVDEALKRGAKRVMTRGLDIPKQPCAEWTCRPIIAKGPGMSAFALDDGVVYHPTPRMHAELTPSGACIRGLSARPKGAMRQARGGAAMMSTTGPRSRVRKEKLLEVQRIGEERSWQSAKSETKNTRNLMSR